MAAYRTSAAGGATSGSGDRTATITPAVGDLFVVFCAVSGNTNAAPTCSDNNGGSYTLVDAKLFGASANAMSVFVRTSLLANTTSTVVTVATGANTAGSVVVVAVSGMSRTGLSAIRGKGGQANQASGGTPAPVLDQTALTGNVTLGGVANSSNPATLTAPTSWTERQDVGQSTPNTGLEVVSRDSGFTGTTITWGSTSGSAFASYAVEIDGSAVPATGTLTTTLDDATLSATGAAQAKGALAATLADATLSSSGVAPVVGTLTKTLADATLSSTGTVGSASGLSLVYGARLAHHWFEGFASNTWTDDAGSSDVTQSPNGTQFPASTTTPGGRVALAFDVDSGAEDVFFDTFVAPPGGTTSAQAFGCFRVDSAGNALLMLPGTILGIELASGALRVNDWAGTGVITSSVLPIGWHTFVVDLRSGGTARLYVDGAFVGSDSFGVAGILADISNGLQFGNGTAGDISFALCSMGIAYDDADFTLDTDALSASDVLEGYIAPALGALAVTLGDATLSGAGSAPVVGSAARTLDNASLTASGAAIAKGTVSRTLDEATVTSSGTARIIGAVAKSLDNATLASAGVARVFGAAAKSLDDAALVAAGVARIVGSTATTLDNATLVGTAVARAAGAVARTLDDASLSGAAVARVLGAVAETLDDATLAAGGTARVIGGVARTLDDAVLTAAGTAGDAPPIIAGELAKTLDDASLVASGAARAAGALAKTLDGANLSAAGISRVAGELARTLDDAALSAGGVVPLVGAVVRMLADAVLSAAGAARVVGAVAANLSDATLAAAGTVADSTGAVHVDRSTVSAVVVTDRASAKPSTVDRSSVARVTRDVA